MLSLSRPLTPTSAPNAEIELKLSIGPEDARRLGRLPSIRQSFARPRAHAERCTASTTTLPAFELRRDGVALRLRRDGKRWIQTLKGAGEVQGGPAPAQGARYTGAGADPEPPRARGFRGERLCSATRHCARSCTRSSPPISAEPCATWSWSRARMSSCASIRARSRLDRPAHPSARSRSSSSRGSRKRCLPLRTGCSTTSGCGSSPPARRSAATRSRPAAAAMPVKAQSPELEAQMTVSEAFRAVVFACLAHLQGNEHGLLESDDAEYLHQARVALRRLRSAFSVFSRAFPRPALEEIIARAALARGQPRSGARLGRVRHRNAAGRDGRAPRRPRRACAARAHHRVENSRGCRSPRRGGVQALHRRCC